MGSVTFLQEFQQLSSTSFQPYLFFVGVFLFELGVLGGLLGLDGIGVDIGVDGKGNKCSGSLGDVGRCGS